MMKAYTDYPFTFLGDKPYCVAPVRAVDVRSYDGDKYCEIEVQGRITEIKCGYLYDSGTSFKPIDPNNLLEKQ